MLPGPGPGPQEGVQGAGAGPNAAHRRRKPPEWLRMSWFSFQAKTAGKRRRRSFTVFDSYTFLILGDERQLREGLDHILLVFVVFFVAVTKQIVQDGLK